MIRIYTCSFKGMTKYLGHRFKNYQHRTRHFNEPMQETVYIFRHRTCFCGTSFVDLLCFLFLYCVCYAFVSACLYVPCGHLLGKSWPLSSRLWYPTVSLSLSHWYPGSGVVLDCIDSWLLHPYLLQMRYFYIWLLDDRTCQIVSLMTQMYNNMQQGQF